MNEKLTEIVAEIFFLDDDEITPELGPDDVELWDSLNHLRMITAVEETFSIKLSMQEIESIDKMSVLNGLVEQHTGGA
jgi:acyl carrier protein